MSTTGKRIAVLGTGAQGAGIASDMAQAGLDVTFIDQWPANVEAIRARGIEVRLPDHTTLTPVKAIHLCQVAEVREKFDMVFVVVKAYDTRWACEMIRPVLADDALVIGLQNGMTIDDMLDVLGPKHTVGAVIEMASNMFNPGITVRQTLQKNSWFTVGGFIPEVQERMPEVVEVLGHAGRVEISEDIRSSKWMKLVGNAAELVPSAILDLPLAEAVQVPGMRDFMDQNGREALRTNVAIGNKILPVFGLTAVDDPEAYAEQLFDIILSEFSAPDTLTTVLQDWRKGRRAETDQIQGTILRAAATVGMPVPANQRTYEIGMEIENGTNTPGMHNLERLLAPLD